MKSHKLPEVTLVVPMYNEEISISSVLLNLNNLDPQIYNIREVILIDDGSKDKSIKVAEATVPSLKYTLQIVRQFKNHGYGFALKTGAIKAKSEYICFCDSDLQHSTESIKALLDKLNELSEIDLIVGARIDHKASPLWRRPGKQIAKKLSEFVTKNTFDDLFSGLRIWKKSSFLRMIGILPNRFSISATSTLAASYSQMQITWVPVSVNKRIGKSSLNLKNALMVILFISRIFILFTPLTLFSIIAFIFYSIGFYFIIKSYVVLGESSVKGLITLILATVILLQGMVMDQIAAIRRGETIKSN